jgi:uncharacterized protein (DUF433 family)
MDWASPEAKPSTAELTESNDWARLFSAPKPSTNYRTLEWYFECSLSGHEVLKNAVEISSRRIGGVPVLKGTRFTVAQTLAELAEIEGIAELAENFDIDEKLIRDMLTGLSLLFMRPFLK